MGSSHKPHLYRMTTIARRLNASLDLTSKLAVVAGGSQGIGAGVAVRFAKAGSSVVILGRNKTLLAQVVNECKRVAKDGPSGKTFEYIEADLSTTSGMKQAAQDIESTTSGRVDYLVQTQGGPPTGRWKENHEGVESRFAVQVLSKFALDYQLASKGVLKEASVTVCAPGGSQTEFDVEDIECRSKKESNALALLAAMGKRDGIVIDTYQKALSKEYPSITYYHLFPGIVTTNGAANSGFPFPIPQLFALASPIISRTFGNSPESYAEIPVLVAANSSAEKQDLVASQGTALNMWLKKVNPAPWSEDPTNQQKIVEKLKSYGV